VVFVSNGTAPPGASTIQSTYETEASNGSPLHDTGLRVIEAECSSAGSEKFLCQVTFSSNDDPEEHLYFDVISLVRNRKGWMLESGLCKPQ
jgi:hypothetical protein